MNDPTPFKWESEEAWEEAYIKEAEQTAAAVQVTPPKDPTSFWAVTAHAWEAFYRRNADAFFKDRHYIANDFPCVSATISACAAAGRPATVIELGCGVGNALLPLLERYPSLLASGFDISAAAVRIFKSHPLGPRIEAFVHDMVIPDPAARRAGAPYVPLGTKRSSGVLEGIRSKWLGGAVDSSGVEGPPYVLEEGSTSSSSTLRVTAGSAAATAFSVTTPRLARGYDLALCFFVASALPAHAHGALFEDAYACLRPGGYFCFRDYGILDAAALRFGRGQRVGESLYCRGDGTLAAFFSTEELAAHAVRAGFTVVELWYMRRRAVNRAEGAERRRCFVHLVVRKPEVFDALAVGAGARSDPDDGVISSKKESMRAEGNKEASGRGPSAAAACSALLADAGAGHYPAITSLLTDAALALAAAGRTG